MKGRHHIVVQNNRVRYEIDVKRNLTIIRGDSATGKTTLVQMLSQYADLGEDSGISVVCDKDIQVLSGRNWKRLLDTFDDQIIFIDEENAFIKTEEFAAAVRDSSCYFVLITREDLPNLPYSVEEIYGIHTSGKYRDTRRVFNEMYHIYSMDTGNEKIRPEIVIAEDSNSGYEFLSHLFTEKGIACISAQGKSNLAVRAQSSEAENILIVGDGAAIGPEMNRIYALMETRRHIHCYFPESFEWIILKSGLIDGNEVRSILEHPENYIESRDYFSWERYFTKILVEYTRDNYQRYQKSHLNAYYLQEHEAEKICAVMPDIGI